MLNKIPISWDMETADPDDVFTLCMLAHHPHVDLRSVTVTPGSRHQIGLVKHILKLLDKNIPVGSKNIEHPKQCVSEFHYKWLGDIPPAEADGNGPDILWTAQYGCADNFKIVCGASLSNLSNYSNRYVIIPEAVIQGGFAGDSVVPEEYRLDKFKGKETCPTFNLNGDIAAAKNVIASDKITKKIFVSKNVCHGIIYDNEMHERIKPHRHNNMGLELLVKGMDFYLQKKPSGKAFHDPLAACVAISPDCCEFKEVEMYREKGEWGSRLKDGTNTFIPIKCNRDRFEQVLVGL